jgi:hypothetical protein
MSACDVARILLLSLLCLQSGPHQVTAFEYTSTQSTKMNPASRVATREYAVLADPSTEPYFAVTSRQIQGASFPAIDRQSVRKSNFAAMATTEIDLIHFPKLLKDRNGRSKSSLKEALLKEVVITKRQGGVHRCSKGLHLPYESALETLRIYHSHHANLVLPQKFIVPKTNGESL